MKRIALVLVIAAAVAVGGYMAFWPRGTGPNGPGGGPGGSSGFAIPVEVAKVRTDTVIRDIPAVGTLRSIESVIIRPEVPGRIDQIRFKEGAPVAKGDVLITLDDNIVRSQLTEARASLNLSKANYERAAQLFRQKVGSAQARDQALANMRVDEARVAVAEAQLDKTVIRAPFKGIVGLKKVSPGDYVNTGQDIVNLEQIDVLKVDFSVPELQLPALALGQTVNITVDALPGRSFAGKVYAIDPLIEAKGRSIAIRAHIDNADHVLRPGLFTRISVVTARIDGALVVPEEAIVPIGQDNFVYRVVDGKAAMTKVKIGVRRPGEVQVTEGLSADDTVVVAGQIKLRDGVPVNPVIPGSPPGGAGGAAKTPNGGKKPAAGSGAPQDK
ncbi:MAG: efflux RND transporter periplasmic adaptor subunit [Alphaproteobacteria bacterium]